MQSINVNTKHKLQKSNNNNWKYVTRITRDLESKRYNEIETLDITPLTKNLSVKEVERSAGRERGGGIWCKRRLIAHTKQMCTQWKIERNRNHNHIQSTLNTDWNATEGTWINKNAERKRAKKERESEENIDGKTPNANTERSVTSDKQQLNRTD